MSPKVRFSGLTVRAVEIDLSSHIKGGLLNEVINYIKIGWGHASLSLLSGFD